MKLSANPLISAIILSLSLTACSSMSKNEQYGTAGGAIAGGALGYALGGSTAATVGGAAAGALIGNQVGKNIE